LTDFQLSFALLLLPVLLSSDAEDLSDCLEGCDVSDTSVLAYFFPINDNSTAIRATAKGGGSHWSTALRLST
jgi:hypothetical protein